MSAAMATAMSRLVDGAGRPVRLGPEIGRGGEGTVYAVLGLPERVVKLYAAPADAGRAAKLAAMVRAATAELADVAAWPTATLHAREGIGDDGRSAAAPVVGLVMPNAAGVPLHSAYAPVARRAEFPHADWRWLVGVAGRLAAAVARVHAAGHVVGDLNPGNVLVAPDGRVRLIDCDSFQIRDPARVDEAGGADAGGADVGGRWFPCEVGVGHFTPPELQELRGGDFAGMVRTANHDAFGLAVLVFHLLFMGRHPFAGRYTGAGELPLERAIAEFRFVFGRHARAVRMAPPPHALPLSGTSPEVADLFERAFGPSGVRDGGRPTAAEWTTALGQLAGGLAVCAAVPGHAYPRALGPCSWCAIAADGGPDFFADVQAGEMSGEGRALAGFDADAVWAAVLAVPAPEPSDSAVPAPQPTTTRGGVAPWPRWRWLAWWGHVVCAIAVPVVVFLPRVDGARGLAEAAGLLVFLCVLRRVSGIPKERERRSRQVEAVRDEFDALEARWLTELGVARDRFRAKRRELDALRAEYAGLDAAREQAWRDLDLRRLEQALAAGPAALRGLGGVAQRHRDHLARALALQQVAVMAAEAQVTALDTFGEAHARVCQYAIQVWLCVTIVAVAAGLCFVFACVFAGLASLADHAPEATPAPSASAPAARSRRAPRGAARSDAPEAARGDGAAVHPTTEDP